MLRVLESLGSPRRSIYLHSSRILFRDHRSDCRTANGPKDMDPTFAGARTSSLSRDFYLSFIWLYYP